MRGRRLLLIVGGVVLLIVVGGIWIVVRAQQAADALASARTGVTQLRADLAAGHIPEATTRLEVIQADAARAVSATDDPVFAIASKVPIVGTTPDAVRQVAGAADSLAQDALPPLVQAGVSLDPNTLRLSGDRLNLEAFNSAAPHLDQATTALRQIDADVAGIDTERTVPKVSDAVASLQTELDDALTETQSAAQAAVLLPPMLGGDGTRHYLLALQSNNEARGTGGFFGSYGILTAKNGRVTVDHLAPRSELDNQTYDSPPVDFGKAYTALYGDDTASWAGANMSPHYPYAAQTWLKMWQDRTGQRLDGVVTTDPVTLSYLLKATGPVTLPDGRVIDSDNVVSYTENQIYFDIPLDDAARDAYLQTVAQASLDAVLSGDANPRALLDAFGESAGQRRLLVYSDRANEEHQLEASDVGGALPNGNEPVAGLATINGGGNKLDYYLGQSLDYQVLECLPDGGRRSQITVTYDNTAPSKGLPLTIDARSDLPLRPDGQPRSGNGDSFFYSQAYATPGSTLISAERDGQPLNVEQGEERGLAVIRAGIEVDAGASTTLTYEIIEPPTSGNVSTFVTPLVKPAPVTADMTECGA